MNPEPEILAVRALNSLRKLHLPTYVAARFLFDSIAGLSTSTWSRDIPLRKYPQRVRPRHRVAQRFKKLNDTDGTIVYREFHIPSPTTALAESVVLSALSGLPSFAKASNIYSYRWPYSPTYPYNFDHYSNGYRQRNLDIAKALALHPGSIVLVSDIERFYPSISQKLLLEQFENAIRGSALPFDLLSLARTIFDHLLLPGGKGITTGPETSHVAGDLALKRVDEALTKRFAGTYFRYVDDIVLVVKPDDVNSALRLLAELISREGLTVHPTKTDHISGEEWVRFGPHNSDSVQDGSFEALLFKVKAFLLREPEQRGELSHRLEDYGFSIPIDRLAAISVSRSFARRFWRLKVRGWFAAMRASVATMEDVFQEALAVRETVMSELKSKLSEDVPMGATLRKWHLQRLRYLVNRSLYLVPDAELERFIGQLERFPEFAETVALLKLLISGDALPLLSMPGPAVATAASKLRQRGAAFTQLPNLPLRNPAILESLGVVEMFQVGSAPDAYVASLSGDDREFLAFCRGDAPLRRERTSMDFLDELRSLQLGRGRGEAISKIETRFSDSEESVLDALDMGGEQSS